MRILIISIFFVWIFCLASCQVEQIKQAADQTWIIDDRIDVIQVPEGGIVEGHRVHKGLFMTERKINQEIERIAVTLNKKLEKESYGYWEAH